MSTDGKPASPQGLMALAAMLGVASGGRAPVDLRGRHCNSCGSSLGHTPGCEEDATERFARHCADHAPCRRTLVKKGLDKFIEDPEGLCARGKRLWDEVRRRE